MTSPGAVLEDSNLSSLAILSCKNNKCTSLTSVCTHWSKQQFLAVIQIPNTLYYWFSFFYILLGVRDLTTKLKPFGIHFIFKSILTQNIVYVSQLSNSILGVFGDDPSSHSHPEVLVVGGHNTLPEEQSIILIKLHVILRVLLTLLQEKLDDPCGQDII